MLNVAASTRHFPESVNTRHVTSVPLATLLLFPSRSTRDRKRQPSAGRTPVSPGCPTAPSTSGATPGPTVPKSRRAPGSSTGNSTTKSRSYFPRLDIIVALLHAEFYGSYFYRFLQFVFSSPLKSSISKTIL